MKWVFTAVLATALAFGAAGGHAQSRDETLADIRQELSFLYVEIQRLKRELITTGFTTPGELESDNVSRRISSLEVELQRVIGEVEALQIHVNNIVEDGTNRIGDLEFRLVELEGGDISTLGETTTLGGDEFATVPVDVDVTSGETGELTVTENLDFENARTTFENGDFQLAAQQFEDFTITYPGGPMNSEAHFLRGESLANLDEWSPAARAYLESFSGAPDGDRAPEALFKLGVSLNRIGQHEEACLTLNEVGVRYPNAEATLWARSEMQNLECG